MSAVGSLARIISMSAPPELIQIARNLRHPAVSQSGVTKLNDAWALLAVVRKDAVTPLEEVERQAGGFPVVYRIEPESPPVARPAFPLKGE